MEYSLREALDHIDPSSLEYQDWVNVGMALKEEGYSADDWDEWSKRDPSRYKKGECRRKWAGFSGSSSPVTGGTIIQMAKDNGWQPEAGGHALEWDDEIFYESVVVDPNWVEGKEIKNPVKWQPERELIRYLEALFDSTDNVGYVTACFEKEGRFMPKKGSWDRTAGQLIEELSKCEGDIGRVFGDYNPDVGAWIRFNPLDGKGIKNENVTEFRYALVESDEMDIAKQNAMIRELELPVAILVHSGKKSLHAIVKIDAADYPEYKKRVDYLYDVCKKNGLNIDQQNRNPSRLSRMPGVMRLGNKQYVVGENMGKGSFAEWKEWIESVNDNLPDTENLSHIWDDIPELSPVLINGILRQGHKMLIAGPSKAGKSFLQIELCIAIAEGMTWIGRECTKGSVLYINLELDRASCLNRFKDMYKALNIPPKNLKNLDVWNLRGKSLPMDRLAPLLIRRASKKNYIAVIIDPIYKIITGDENSADQMAKFCNQFDKICTEIGVATIYCHHHSKGSQGAKRSMDRASGSGVFARDPDALLDIIELETTEAIMEQEVNKAVCKTIKGYLNTTSLDWQEDLSQDDLLSSTQMYGYCKEKLARKQMADINKAVGLAEERVQAMTAWRIEATLREFAKPQPINLWFDYPTHYMDESGVLGDIKLDYEIPSYQKGARKMQDNNKKSSNDAQAALENAINNCSFDECPTIEEVAEYLGITGNAVRKRLEKSKAFLYDKNEKKIKRKV